VGRWRLVKPNANFGHPPPTRPFGHEITGNLPMKLQQEFAGGRLQAKRIGRNGAFNPQNPLSQQRCLLGVAQDASGGLDEAGGAGWRCSFSSHERSTLSLSNAMDSATCRGILRQQIRCWASGFSRCQR